MKKIFISAAIAASLFSLYNCKDTPKAESKSLTKEITFTKEGELSLLKAENDSIIATLDIEIADDEYSTQTGLMYRHSMDGNQGMLFIFDDSLPRSFYMKNTEIPLDIIYFNAKKEIVSIQKNAKSFDETSLPSEAASQYVLEVNAGLSDRWKLGKGDRIKFTKY
ncbi:hypothetical protein Aeqsu_0579 [Aequorivita sublithincola DSM 14238]|uniref:DUF192 domain-containing protein n=1 Tax=Aequorivita sublithincola (strain DSM 14238 / LMG 21431 / ACAM 643 / 9-3) TaxID=746697 RepID=I3YSX1_AEQSU|nr:DUF192 domain-containing protein [Aequorivita sublithincola]AFL80089.1 hypothetical protein Aeqsu_0579 [Aequorivita sublithincola DSM 14238]